MDLVEVPIGECRCPGSPHPDGDVVYLRPKPDLYMGLAARAALHQNNGMVGDAEAAFYSVFIRHGVIAWNILDDRSKPLPITHDSVVDRLGWGEGGAIVALRAMSLYQDAVLDPLAEARSVLSRLTHSNGSISANPDSGVSTPKSRKRSSPLPPAATQ